MALNKYMHPRNIYKVPPDFANLANIHPEFAAIIKTEITGKVTIDFKDTNALRIFTKCLLKSDFNLDVDIPEDRLVPTLPLRLNYILWIEDLLASLQRNKDIKGLDIGTGACAIYPLLGSAKNKWKMLGTETDLQSFKKAEENIQKNNLQDLIKLRHHTSTSIIAHVFLDDDTPTFDFCMCNPPFYSNMQELCESRSPARLPPKNGFTGSPQELITEGGELEFCRKLIKESMQYKNNVLVFTTMVGHKCNLSELIQDIKSENLKYTHTEFCQGRVTRWGLAWTYQGYDIATLVPPRNKPRKKTAPTVHLLPELPNCTYNIEAALSKIKELLNSLNINNRLLEKHGNNVTMDIIANTNTWSNQRRKRRLQKRAETQTKQIKLDIASDETKINKCDTHFFSDEQLPHCSNPSEAQSPNKINLNKIENVEIPTPTENLYNQPIVHAFTRLIKKGNDILLEIEFLNGSAGKEGLHQIVQYIKNNWK